MQTWLFRETLGSTFGDESVFVRARHRAVNLADQLHVVEESIEGIEVGEAHHVGGAPSRSLQQDQKPVRPTGKEGLRMDLIMFLQIFLN